MDGSSGKTYSAHLAGRTEDAVDLILDVGGGMAITFSELPRTGDLPESAIEM
jgi:hypothetical protein